MALSGYCVVFFCFSFRGNNCYKSLNGAMFGLFRLFYYFFRLEISFVLLFEDDWFVCEVFYERKFFLSVVLLIEFNNMD